MSRLTMLKYRFDSVVAEYEPEHSFPGSVGRRIEVPSHVRLRLSGEDGSDWLILDIEHMRQLAEELPRLLMAHDAAEHAAREQAAAVAEYKAA